MRMGCRMLRRRPLSESGIRDAGLALLLFHSCLAGKCNPEQERSAGFLSRCMQAQPMSCFCRLLRFCPAFTSATVKASVTEHSERAFITFGGVMRNIQFLRRNPATEVVPEVKMDRFSLPGHTGVKRLGVLKLLTADPEHMFVFDEDCSRLHKAKSDTPRHAFFPQRLHPVEITRSCSSVVFSSAGHLFNPAAVKIPANANRAHQRSAV